MVAGLKGDVKGSPSRCSSGLIKGHDLGVVPTCPRMPALTHNAALARDDGPHERVRRNRVTPALSKAAGEIHGRIPQHIFLSPIRTLTVGAGLRLVARTRTFTGSTSWLSQEARGLPEKTIPFGLTAGAGIPPAPES